MRCVDSRTRLRTLLVLLLIGLAVPAWVLFCQASNQLDLEAFRRQQLLAEDTTRRIDATLVAAIAAESARPFDDYRFATAPVNATGNIVQRSPLSSWPATTTLPGVIGHFQVGAGGVLTTPLLPADGDAGDFGLTAAQIGERRQHETQIVGILAQNRLVRASPTVPGERVREQSLERQQYRRAEAASFASDAEIGQAAFDELTARNAGSPPAAILGDAASEVESAALPKAEADAEAAAAMTDTGRAAELSEQLVTAAAPRIAAFDAEIEPLQFSRLDTGHLVLYRNAWRDGMRFIQGILLDTGEFLTGATGNAFLAGGHAAGTRIFAAFGSATAVELTPQTVRWSSDDRSEEILYSTRLSPPLAQIALTYAAGELPRGPASRVLMWTAIVLVGVLLGGLYVMYRFGSQQIALTRQQEDFVSAVSHELKTPLTSIRMYGEMLKSGWANDEKKQSYYDYIHSEGERLSRLIDNVLYVARFNRGAVPVTSQEISVEALLDIVRSRVSTTVESAGFTLQIDRDSVAGDARLLVDQDAVVQIFINLIDNAIKFARDEDRHEIVAAATLQGPDSVVISVRDYGPGVSPRHMKRLFELFYRPDDDRTRMTSGTGIGLALVRQLVTAMGGSVDVRNCEPGAEFRLTFPRSA